MGIKKLIITGAIATGVLLTGGALTSAEESHSVVDYLYNKGADYSYDNRKKLASEYGISNYRGEANQNLALLANLKGERVEATTQPAQVQAEPKQQTEHTYTMTATAYTASCKGCSGVTATGIDLNANPNQKVVAVDPRVIPLGSKLYVEGYGYAVAGDVGGAIKNNKIDLYVRSYSEAMNWGRRTVKVTVLN